jgi:HAD superfamily hydrolase (TIGR01509 family)
MSTGSSRRVRAILFDAGNTLLRMDYAAIAAELGRLGTAVAPEAVERAEWRARVRLDVEVLSDRAVELSTESQSTASCYVRFLLAALGVVDERTIEALAAWRRAYNPPEGLWTVADPEAEPALRLAREAGLGVAVISNSNGTVRSVLETLGLTRHVDFVIDSGEVGVEKPDPRIFRLALDRLGLDPPDAVYVGDIYSVDVLGARAAGLDAVLLDPGGCWGARDCPLAPGVLGAVRLILAQSGGGVTKG